MCKNSVYIHLRRTSAYGKLGIFAKHITVCIYSGNRVSVRHRHANRIFYRLPDRIKNRIAIRHCIRCGYYIRFGCQTALRPAAKDISLSLRHCVCKRNRASGRRIRCARISGESAAVCVIDKLGIFMPHRKKRY